MINIFNLFLFLFAIWIVLTLISGEFSLTFIVLGLSASLAISLLSWKLKIINKNFNFLFLNLGFYHHFFIIFFISFVRSILLLIKATFSKEDKQNCLFQIKPKTILSKSELSLFIATISFIPGISYLGIKNGNIMIYALSEDLFRKANLDKIYYNIHKINDDSLI